MLQSLVLELRDKATFIPIIATSTSTTMASEQEAWILRRAGYNPSDNLIILSRANGGKSNYDPYKWGDRTFAVAHKYISENWSSLKAGQVIDVEFILGETTEPKKSEIFG